MAQAANACSGSPVPPSPPEKTVLFPVAEVRRGLCGVAYTVFEGVHPEPMQVELLGVMKNARGPGQDMILSRLHGLKPEYTGVVAGMSGSPVYVDGKLLGALSFRIGQFSKEAIAGITPIGEMLSVLESSASSDGTRTFSATSESKTLGNSTISPIDTPLVLTGFTSETIDRFGDRFRALGLTPVAGLGTAAGDQPQPEPIVPGSAVSAILVRGDLSMAGTCTVTYVDKDNLFACGHPITQFGHIAFPMTKATVLATLPSPLNAFKIVTTTETVGQFTEDRNAAIVGRFGQSARMIPVEVTITGEPAPAGKTIPERTLRFEVVDNKDLTPTLMLVSVFQGVQQTNLSSAESSYRVTGEIAIQGTTPLTFDSIMAPNEVNPAAINTALFVNERFSRIYSNTATQPVIKGLKLTLRWIGPNRTGTLERVRSSRVEVRPGEKIEVEATLRPLRSEPLTLRIPVRIPEDTVPGELRLLISDGTMADHATLSLTPPGQTLSLQDVVRQLHQIHSNDRIYVTLLTHDAQAFLEGATMSAVPLSMANIFESQRSEQKVQVAGESAEELGFAGADYAISGAQILSLKVK